MEAAYYTSNGIEYKVTSCTYQDVEEHYNKVVEHLHSIGEVMENGEEYCHRMLECVDSGVTIKVEARGEVVGFTYTILGPNPVEVYGRSLLTPNEFTAAALIFKHIEDAYPNAKRILVVPHGPNFINSIKSACTPGSIRRYYAGSTYVKIDILKLARIGKRINEYRGGIQKVDRKD